MVQNDQRCKTSLLTLAAVAARVPSPRGRAPVLQRLYKEQLNKQQLNLLSAVSKRLKDAQGKMGRKERGQKGNALT